MDKELLDIVDTAVKIGLGASISGITAYFIARYNHSKESEKEYIKRRMDILETAIENVDTYFNKLFDLYTSVDGIKKNKPDLEKIDNEDDFKFILKADKEFIQSRHAKSIAITKLRLIGLKKSVDALKKAQKLEQALRKQIIFERVLPAHKDIKSWGSRILKIQECVGSGL